MDYRLVVLDEKNIVVTIEEYASEMEAWEAADIYEDLYPENFRVCVYSHDPIEENPTFDEPYFVE